MLDEDLNYLHDMLRHMEPDAQISINHFICSARELHWVVEEALSAREQAKAAGVYQAFPIESPLSE